MGVTARVETESFSSYRDHSFCDTSDALMKTGGDSSPTPERKKKKEFLASIFGGKKKPQPPKERPLENEVAGLPQSYVPKHVGDPDLEIQDGIMETGIIEREEDEYEERPRHHKPHVTWAEEEDLFEEEDAPPMPRKRASPDTATVQRVSPPPALWGNHPQEEIPMSVVSAARLRRRSRRSLNQECRSAGPATVP